MKRTIFLLLAFVLILSVSHGANDHTIAITMTAINEITITGAVAITLPAAPGVAWSSTHDTSTIAYQHNAAADQKIQITKSDVSGDWTNVFLRVSPATNEWGTEVAAPIVLADGASDTGAAVSAVDFISDLPAGDYSTRAILYEAYHTWGALFGAKSLKITYTTLAN